MSALCDIISHKFGSINKSDLSNASRRRMECLIFCLTLYVVCTLSLFWKRFEVSKYNLSFNLLSFSLVRSYLIYQFLMSSYWYCFLTWLKVHQQSLKLPSITKLKYENECWLEWNYDEFSNILNSKRDRVWRDDLS